MSRLLKIGLGSIVGTICGSLVGMAMLGIPAYFAGECGIRGCTKEWSLIVLYSGVIFGCVVGLVIGLTVGAVSSNKTISAIVGAAIGSIITIVLFLLGAAAEVFVSVLAILSIPAGAFIGLVVSTSLGVLRDPNQHGSRVRNSI